MTDQKEPVLLSGDVSILPQSCKVGDTFMFRNVSGGSVTISLPNQQTIVAPPSYAPFLLEKLREAP